MTRFVHFLQGLAANLVILALVAGVPFGLVSVFGNVYGAAGTVFRDGYASENALIEALLKVTLVSTAWLAWAMVVAALIAQAVGEIRGAEFHIPAVPRGFNRAAGRLVASAAMIVTAFAPSPRTAYSSPLAAPANADEVAQLVPQSHPRQAVATDDASPATRVRTVAMTRYVVGRGDHWWTMAEQFLHDGTRWPEIIAANAGRSMADGVTITENTPRPRAGWVLQIPIDSRGEEAGDSRRDAAVVVEHGDNLWNLTEQRWGSTDMERIERVAETNEIVDPDLIYPGEVIDLSNPDQPRDRPSAERPSDRRRSASDTDTDVSPPVEPVEPVVESATPGRQTFEVELDAGTVGAAVSAPDSPSGTQGPEPREPAGGSSTHFPPPRPAADPAEAGAPETTTDAHFGSWELSLLLTGGLVGLLTARRRRLWRTLQHFGRPSEVSIELEQRLRAAARERATTPPDPAGEVTTEELQRLFRVLENVAAERHTTMSAVVRSETGAVIVYFEDAIEPGDGWTGGGRVWANAGQSLALETEWSTDDATVPAMIELGATEAHDRVFVNLETLNTLEVGGPEESAVAIVDAITLGLASEEALSSAALIGVGIDEDLLLHHPGAMSVPDFDTAMTRAEMLVGTSRFDRPVSAIRESGVDYGEFWEPAIIIAGAGVAQVRAPAVNRVALVSAAPVLGPAHVLAPDGDQWIIQPLGIRFTPVGIGRGERQLMSNLLADASIGGADARIGRSVDAFPADTLEGERAADQTLEPVVESPFIEPAITVRILGPIEIETADGPIAFQRSKSKELLVWLALHGQAPTRTGARGALWNFTIRETPFRNVVSDLRRTLDLAVPPPAGETWLERTQTELLPLRSGVSTDVATLEYAVAQARDMSPSDRVEVLRPAVELIRGVPFDGADYLWPDAEGLTSDMILLAAGAIVDLADAYRSVGDIDAALAVSGRGLALFAGHEALVAAHLHALDEIGDQQAIAVAWEEYEATLCDDAWGPYEPSPKLAALHQRIRAKRASFAPPGG